MTDRLPVPQVFDEEELRGIGKVAEDNDLLILSDEVYDCLTFGEEHVRIAALDDFWRRTVTVGSAVRTLAASTLTSTAHSFFLATRESPLPPRAGE